MQPAELASSTPSVPISSSTLVYDLDIFLLAVLLAFFLFNTPSALAYIASNRSDTFQGYLLRSATPFRMYRPPSETTLQSKEEQPAEYSIPTLRSTVVLKQPWHFPMRFSLRHPAASFMQYRILGNYTVVQTSLIAVYTAAVFLVAFYQSNPFTNPQRIGWVIASQIPFVYALGTKNNVIGMLVGVGYEKLNFLHRHVGRLMVIAANVHTIGYIYKWSLGGTVSQKLAVPYIRWGFVALACFDLLGFFSIQFVRTKSYNLFFGTHVVGLIVTLFAVCYHQPVCIPYVIAASTVYGLDHILRVIKSRITAANIRTIPEMGLTRVDIPSLNTGWRPGQHVRLRVLSAAMGLWGMSEVHPFTIASATSTADGLVLMCKKTGNWTKHLYELAETSESDEQGREIGRKIKVMIGGPYGGVGNTTISNYSGAMFVVGGSGVTFALSAVQDLVLAGNRSKTRVIEIVWSITDPAALEPFLPMFYTLVSQSGPARVRVSVFYTRATTYSFEHISLPPGITLTAGRPNIRRHLDGLVACIMSKGGANGAFVAVCGPVGLSETVMDAVRTYDVTSKRAIGGTEFHEEVFGW